MPLIDIDTKDKKELDNIAAELAVKRKVKSITYAEVITVVLDLWVQVNVSKTLEVMQK